MAMDFMTWQATFGSGVRIGMILIIIANHPCVILKDPPLRNPQGPSSPSYRVLRGGAWNDGTNFLRVAGRLLNLSTPHLRFFNYGFRCVAGSK